MVDNLLFPTRITDIHLDGVHIRVHEVADFDAVLEHYVEVAPTDTDMIPYYAELWPSALAMAKWLTEHSDLWQGVRLIELGCGLGLPSLVARFLGARVTATDYHPDNGPFFRANAEMNGLEDIDYVRMDWRHPCLRHPFDVVLGSDLIYEKSMIDPLAECLAQLCRKGSRFILSDPGRPHLQYACSRLEQLGFSTQIETVDDVFVVQFLMKPAGDRASG